MQMLQFLYYLRQDKAFGSLQATKLGNVFFGDCFQ